MKAVILAAGRGSRFGSITHSLPKPLIPVLGKPLICHVLDALPDEIDQYCIVLGYLGSMIQEYIGNWYNGRKVHYVCQILSGTGGALKAAESFLENDERFLVIGADDIFDSLELKKLIQKPVSWGVWYGCSNKGAQSTIIFDGQYVLKGLVAFEYPDEPRYVGVGAYVLPRAVFAESFISLPNGELSLPHTLAIAAFTIDIVFFRRWIPVNTLEELSFAEEQLLVQTCQKTS